MLVFVDESGDPGMKLGKGSSDFFAVVAVIFADRNVASACNNAIKSLRATLGFHERHEFKFSKCNRQMRMAFLQSVAAFPFVYHAIVLNKRKLSGPGFQFRDSLYKYPIRLVFENARPLLNEATVFFDTCGSREFVRQLKEYLRRILKDSAGNCPIRKFTPEKSHNNNLIQLADMICGAVARSYKTDKTDSGDYRKLVKGREARAQFWPT